MAELPCLLETEHALVVHWGFDPDVPLIDQDEDVLVGRGGDNHHRPNRSSLPPRWVDVYRGPKPIAFGHRTLSDRFLGDHAINLGAHCVCGQDLFGVVLPERRLVSVRARANYWARLRPEARAIAIADNRHLSQAQLSKLSFGDLDRLVRGGSASREARLLHHRAARSLDELTADLRRRTDSLLGSLPDSPSSVGSHEWMKAVMPEIEDSTLKGFIAATARGTEDREAVLRANRTIAKLIKGAEQSRRQWDSETLPAGSRAPSSSGAKMRDEANRTLLVLDLDETLIHGTETPLDRPADLVFDRFFIYKRPHVGEFLSSIFGDFDVAIWSSASSDYVEAVAEALVPAGLSFTFVWSSRKCTYHYDGKFQDYYWIKRLKKVKQAFGFPMSHILIVDDQPSKCHQNYGNAVYVRPFEGDPEDDELRWLARYLKTLADVPDVRPLEKRGWRSKMAGESLLGHGLEPRPRPGRLSVSACASGQPSRESTVKRRAPLPGVEACYDLKELAQHNWHIHTVRSSCASPRLTVAAVAEAAETAGLKTVALVNHHHRPGDELPDHHSSAATETADANSSSRLVLGAELSAYGIGKYADTASQNDRVSFRLYACNHYQLAHWEHPDDRSPRGYAEHMLQVLRILLPTNRADCIAHPFAIDYLTRCAHAPAAITRAITDTELADVLELGRSHGVAWEINVDACLSDEPFARRYWRIGKRVGVTFLLGTDAHDLDEIDPAPMLGKLSHCLTGRLLM